MVEEWCSVLKGACVWVTHFEHRSLHKYTKVARGQEHDRSGAGEEGYAALCARCEGRERNQIWPLRSTCCTV